MGLSISDSCGRIHSIYFGKNPADSLAIVLATSSGVFPYENSGYLQGDKLRLKIAYEAYMRAQALKFELFKQAVSVMNEAL